MSGGRPELTSVGFRIVDGADVTSASSREISQEQSQVEHSVFGTSNGYPNPIEGSIDHLQPISRQPISESFGFTFNPCLTAESDFALSSSMTGQGFHDSADTTWRSCDMNALQGDPFSSNRFISYTPFLNNWNTEISDSGFCPSTRKCGTNPSQASQFDSMLSVGDFMVDTPPFQGNRDYFQLLQSKSDVEDHVSENQHEQLATIQPIESATTEGAASSTYDRFGYNFAPPGSGNNRLSFMRPDQMSLRQRSTLDMSQCRVEPGFSPHPEHAMHLVPSGMIGHTQSLSGVEGKGECSKSSSNDVAFKKSRVGRKGKVSGVCIKCRLSRVKCVGEPCCTQCNKSIAPRIWKFPCTKAEFFDIVAAGSLFPFASLYEATKIEVLTPIAIVRISEMMYRLYGRDETICVANNRVLFPYQVNMNLPWLLGLLGMRAICARTPANNATVSVSAVREGLLELARAIKTTTGLVNYGYDCTDEVTALRAQLFFCHCGPYCWDDLDVEGSTQDHKRLVSDTVGLLIYIVVRQMELGLFRYLQDISNDMKRNNVGKNHTYITFLLLMLVTTTPLSQNMVEKFDLDSKEHTINSVKSDHLDRVDRVRTALWIYTNIAIGELPALTNFWEKTLEMHPLMTKRLLCEHIRTDKDGLNKGLEQAAEPIWKDWERAKSMLSHTQRDYRSKDKSLYSVEEIGQLSPEEVQEEIKGLRDFYTPGFLKKAMIQYDKHFTGGLFTADTEEKQVRAAAARFRYFSSMDWLSCFSEDDRELSRIGFVAFFNTVMRRFMDMQYFEVFQEKLHEYNGTSPGDPISFRDLFQILAQYADDSSSESEDSEQEESGDGSICRSLRFAERGRRWSELADLLGAEEIIFIGGVHDDPYQEGDDKNLNIPMIIEKGSDEEYENLKSLLRAELGWLVKICSQLRGIFPMILEAESLRHSDPPRAKALAEEVQERCIATLGKSSICDDTWMDPTSSLYHGAFSIISFTLSRSVDEAPYTSNKDDERTLFFEILTRTLIESPMLGATRNDTMTLACIEQTLVQAKESFLREYDKRLQQHGSCSVGGKGQMLTRKTLLTQAIDSLSKLVLTTLRSKSNQQSEVTETEREVDIECFTRDCTKCTKLFVQAMSGRS